jgi:hypothetical protein
MRQGTPLCVWKIFELVPIQVSSLAQIGADDIGQFFCGGICGPQFSLHFTQPPHGATLVRWYSVFDQRPRAKPKEYEHSEYQFHFVCYSDEHK